MSWPEGRNAATRRGDRGRPSYPLASTSPLFGPNLSGAGSFCTPLCPEYSPVHTRKRRRQSFWSVSSPDEWRRRDESGDPHRLTSQPRLAKRLRCLRGGIQDIFGPVWPGPAPAGSQNGKAERDAWLPAPGRLNARAGTIQGILRPPKGLVPRLVARYGVRRIAVHGRSLNVREAAHQRAERVGGHTVVARLLGRGNRLA